MESRDHLSCQEENSWLQLHWQALEDILHLCDVERVFFTWDGALSWAIDHLNDSIFASTIIKVA